MDKKLVKEDRMKKELGEKITRKLINTLSDRNTMEIHVRKAADMIYTGEPEDKLKFYLKERE